jgi:hypothetical protein
MLAILALFAAFILMGIIVGITGVDVPDKWGGPWED